MDIRLENVTKAYGDKMVLDNLSLVFEDGRTTALMGPSGQGKTTILRVLLGLEEYTGSVCGMPSNEAISVVFQDDVLLPWLSVKENIELVGPKYPISEALELVELSGCENMKPGELSGGMQRRAALARAIAHGGSVMILDEPFTGLDEELKVRIMSRLKALWTERKTTVILITHSDSEATVLTDTIITL